jgi:hypothetical protein
MGDFDTKFYRVERTPLAQNANRSWRGKAKIIRKDTDEVVDQVAVRYGLSPEEVQRQLEATVQETLAHLPKPPDWGKDRTIPAFINRYFAIRDQTYGFFLEAERVPSATQARALRQEGDAFEAAALQVLKHEVDKLSEAQKIALVAPTPQQKTHRDDPRVLDTLSAKKVLSRLIDEPSPQVRAGYQALEALLNAEKP